MTKITVHTKFIILGIYVYVQGAGWVLLTEFQNLPFSRRTHLISHFYPCSWERIRANEYWLYDFNDVIKMEDFDKFRIKIRIIPVL